MEYGTMGENPDLKLTLRELGKGDTSQSGQSVITYYDGKIHHHTVEYTTE